MNNVIRRKVLIELVYLFIIGAVIGSFLNVCIYRIPKGESVSFPSSHCPVCKERIKWYDNIPIASYIVLGGKCRVCKSKISIQYPIIEVINGIFFLLVYLKFGFSLLSIKYFIFVSILLILSMIDLKSYFLPDSLTFTLIILGIILNFLSGFSLELSFLGASTYAFPFLIIYGFGEYVFKKEALGFGDIKLASGIGAFLGYTGFYYLYLWFTVTFVLGSIISLILIGLKIKERKEQIPFAPYLSLAAIIMMLLFW